MSLVRLALPMFLVCRLFLFPFTIFNALHSHTIAPTGLHLSPIPHLTWGASKC